ncbi:STAS domain-containing protein [Pontibacter sp. 172403-2]|uniref:STAS domain-containing protein n=1 Tax=Pontibacter rufus TaxID=2791028 RepID=UPI0018AF5985|nr:STAS domain-containing protein [Pontibacter sp. 172403-2]MBF9254463.1 STAS domain-containing protein [Pontibacter sp. 172403-2]
MSLNTLYLQDCCFVEAKGELDADTYRQMIQILDKAIAAKLRNVWVDCEQATAVSTQVLRMMLQHSSKADAAHINLVFYQVSPQLQTAFKNSGLDSVLRIVPTIKEAYQYSRQQ